MRHVLARVHARRVVPWAVLGLLLGGVPAPVAQAAPARRPAARDADSVDARLKYRACAAAHREEGVTSCREALAAGLGTERAARTQLLLARALGTVERWDEALDAYLEALRLQPDDPDAARRVGQVLLYALDRAGEAESYLRQALAARADDAGLHADLGLALNALGRHEEALGEFQAALGLDAAAMAERPASAATQAASQRSLLWP